MGDINVSPHEGHSILDKDNNSMAVCRMCFACVSDTKGKQWVHPTKSSLLAHRVAVSTSVQEPWHDIPSDAKEDGPISLDDHVGIEAKSPCSLTNSPSFKNQNATVQRHPVSGSDSQESSSSIDMGNSSSLENSISSLGRFSVWLVLCCSLFVILIFWGDLFLLEIN